MTTSLTRIPRTGAHRDSIEVHQTDLVTALHEKLGGKLVAYIVDRADSTISRWRTGSIDASEASLVPLRVAYQVVRLLENAEADATIRAWFMGMNPQLDDISPAEALRNGMNREALAAARAFLAGG